MIKPEPVPENLLARSLRQAFTTEEWPEWDNLDLVPESLGTPDDDFDFEPAYDADTEEPAELQNDSHSAENITDSAENKASDFGLDSPANDVPTAQEADLDVSEGEQSDDDGISDYEDTFDF